MVMEALKTDVCNWYDTEPGCNATSWLALKDALMQLYGETNLLDNSLDTISAMNLKNRPDITSENFTLASNETFATFEQHLRSQFKLLQANRIKSKTALLNNDTDTRLGSNDHL
ncbi:hypothetical protein BB560_006117, partial [Smittium megazygosporum]